MVTVAAKKVIARLAELEWNHADLARAMRDAGAPVAEGLVSRWLSGKHGPDALRGTVLDEVLGLKVAKLWRTAAKGRAA